jgi:4-amino-4-deoxy-L-arabinose transferase-like glycosyltransferase
MKKFFHKNKIIIVLGLIVIIAAFFRFWHLTQIPLGFNADEAAIGYNSWSILNTGRDEFGNFLPVAFTSFGDFKPPLYIYLSIPSVAIFGLTEFAVRSPSAFFGVLTVIITFFLTQELFGKFWISASAAFILSISPWHIHYSRGGWETNLFTFLLTLGMYLFLKALKDKKFLYLSAFVFALSFYSYQGARLVTPFLVMLLFLFFKSNLFKFKKHFIGSIFLGFLILLPAFYTFFTGAAFSRFSGVSIFADSGPFWQVNELRGQHTNPNSYLVQFIHNKVESYSIVALKNFSSHFGGDFLFIKGDPIPRNNIVGQGPLLLFSLPFLVLGSFFLLRNRSKFWFLPYILLLAAPSASALTFQSPQALRSASMVVPLAIIAGYGLYYSIFHLFNKKILLILFITFSGFLLVYSFSRFWYFYTVHNPQEIPIAFQPGFSELVPYVLKNKDNFEKVIVTDKYDQPYILFLFYSKYNPQTFAKEAKLTPRDKFGFSTVRNFDKFEFRSINWSEDSKLKNVLIVGTAEDIPQDIPSLKNILFPNGSIAFKIVSR